MLAGTIVKIESASVENLIYSGEVFIMTIFGAGGGFASLTAALVEGNRGWGSSKLADTVRLCLLVAYSAFSVWFWFVGITSLVSMPFPRNKISGDLKAL